MWTPLTVAHYNIDYSHEYNIEQNESNTEEHILCDSFHVKF